MTEEQDPGTRAGELIVSAKDYELRLLEARGLVAELVRTGQIGARQAELLNSGVDLLLTHEGILPPESDIDEQRVFGG
jgi:hypothetical protein